jgi:UPF0716 protein FxsA
MTVAGLLVVLFLVVPIVEIVVIVQVGQQIGALPTILLLLVESAIGAWLVKREGRRAWAALQTAGSTGRLPSRELADAGLILVGGTLLLTPGFVTDVVGFFLILPPTRPLARKALGWFLARRASVVVSRRTGVPPGAWRAGRGHGPTGAGGPRGSSRPSGPGGGRVVPGEVVRDDPPDPGRQGPSGESPDTQGPGRATGG